MNKINLKKNTFDDGLCVCSVFIFELTRSVLSFSL